MPAPLRTLSFGNEHLRRLTTLCLRALQRLLICYIRAMVSFLSEMKVAARSLCRAKGLTVTVVLTLALGIGANAAIFSLVRGVLLRPLVNRDEDRLIYIRQSAKGNATFSI